MRSDNFGSQLHWKSKIWIFAFLNVYISWIEQDKILISQLSPPKFRYFTDQNGPKGGPHENEFWSQIELKKEMKKWGHLPSFLFSFWVMVLKLPKIVHFLQICADFSKKSKSIKSNLFIHIRLDHALSENSMFYRGLSNSSWDIAE